VLDDDMNHMDAAVAEPDRASLAHALRELEAAKFRVERDARQVADEMRKDLIQRLLPVLDNLDRTIAAADQSGEAPAMLEGAQLVRSQLEGVLRGYGVERIEAVGQHFDPTIHDAVAAHQVRSHAEHDLVVDQIAPGYWFGDNLLRPARVVVGRYR
jgi:molecular chaperone GrpE